MQILEDGKCPKCGYTTPPLPNVVLCPANIEDAMRAVHCEYPCAHILIVSEAMAGLALRMSVLFPKLVVSVDTTLHAVEWKLASLTPDLKTKVFHSTGGV